MLGYVMAVWPGSLRFDISLLVRQYGLPVLVGHDDMIDTCCLSKHKQHSYIGDSIY